MTRHPTKSAHPGRRKYIESIAGFNGTVFWFEENYSVTMRLGVVEPNEDFPMGFYYEFNLFGPDALGKSTVRILAAGNSHASLDVKHPFDHWHETKLNEQGKPCGVQKGKFVKVESMEAHIGKFLNSAQALLISLGVNPEVLQIKTIELQHNAGFGQQ